MAASPPSQDRGPDWQNFAVEEPGLHKCRPSCSSRFLPVDHRRDLHENHLLRMCQIRPVNEQTARDAARMRTTSGRADDISATDAIVAAFAANVSNSVILTGDPTDLTDLVATQPVPVKISAV